jgi:hypothetical protein
MNKHMNNERVRYLNKYDVLLVKRLQLRGETVSQCGSNRG